MKNQTVEQVRHGKNLIVASLVTSEQERLDFLPRVFSKYFLDVQPYVYHHMSSLCQEYTGGYWHFYDLSNNGGYLGLDKSDTYRIVVPGNYFDGELNGDAAGIVATLFALSHLAELKGSELLIDRYHELLAYSRSHEEAGLISSAID